MKETVVLVVYDIEIMADHLLLPGRVKPQQIMFGAVGRA